MSTQRFEYKQEQAREARFQAAELRDLHLTATCGLDMKIQFGSRSVPRHIAMRVADQFPIWAAEYDAVADRLEAEMEAMFATGRTDGSSDGPR